MISPLTGYSMLYVFLRFVTTLFMIAEDPSIHLAGAGMGLIVDRTGYRPDDPKIAFVHSAHSGSFEVLDERSGTSAHSSRIGGIGIKDIATGDTLFTLDFSELKKAGKYRLYIPTTGEFSSSFEIREDVYRPAAALALQSFYYQRCGIAVANSSQWKHPPCHTDDAMVLEQPTTVMPTVGGWHDAGDYNKFIPTTALSLAFLQYAYEDGPSLWWDGQLDIPEAGNGIPDILDEARWALTWMLKMQGSDGSVAHKVSIKKWTAEHTPDAERDVRYVFGVSSASTGDFAAATALGARIFEPFDRAFSQELLRASTRAWTFLEEHPSIVPAGGFVNPAGVEGGDYGDTQDDDERLWAAAELYRTTGSRKYHDYFLTHCRRLGGITYTVSWQRVLNFAYFTYLKTTKSRIDLQARAFIIGTLTNYADNLVRRIRISGYRFVLNPDEYYWGSNSVALGYAFDLLQAHAITGNTTYSHAAIDQLHYIMGRNPFDLIFITGNSSASVRNPYHQWSMLSYPKNPIPGMVVAGANSNSRLGGRMLSPYPGKCYEDNKKNYYVNETAINYTAPFVYVAGMLSPPQITSVDVRQSQRK